jgi:uncharacterized protein YjbI with pentapeptide repeats
MNKIQINNDVKKAWIPVKSLKKINNNTNYYIENESFIEKKEFSDCTFTGISENSEFKQNIFIKCSFNNFKLTGFLIKNTRFDICYTESTAIKHSKIIRAEFNNSKLLGLAFYSNIGSDITFLNSNCQFADFNNTKFTKTIFENCNLQEANFQNADLRGVIFKNCDLRKAQFSFAKLFGTNFSNSKIEGVKAHYENFYGAIVDYSQAAYLGTKYLKLNIE